MTLRSLSLALLFAGATAGASAWADSTPPQGFVLEGNQLNVPAPVTFETGSDKLRPESAAAIAHVKAYLDAKSYISLMRVEVHSDAQGGAAFNQTMSEKRALAVAHALVAAGVDCKRVIPVGFGETKPIADNSTAEGRAANRRVVFTNAALRGHAIGGMPVDGGGKVAGDPCR